MKLPAKLEMLFQRKGLTADGLANGVFQGIASDSTIRRWTKDERPGPSLSDAKILARELNVPIGYLADDEMDEFPREIKRTAAREVIENKIEELGEEAALRLLLGAPPATRSLNSDVPPPLPGAPPRDSYRHE